MSSGSIDCSQTTQNFALEDPNLNADHTVSGVGFRSCVVDVGAQGVQGHTTFTVPFGTRDFSSAQTTGNASSRAS